MGLTLDGPNQILYTTDSPGQLELYNLNTHVNSTVVTLNTQQNQNGTYVTMDPGGTSALFGVTNLGIERVNLPTDAVSPLVNFSDPRGMAYDNAGHLFAVLGPNEVAQINPTTGAIVMSISTLPFTGSAGASGLTFDSSTGNLFVTENTNNIGQRGVYLIPTNLSSATLLPSTAGLLAYGLTADGHGDLYVAGDNISGNNSLQEYNIGSGTLTTLASDPAITDVALTPSMQTSTPEPATLTLLGTGVIGLAQCLRRRIRI